jgi:hypothetical protein
LSLLPFSLDSSLRDFLLLEVTNPIFTWFLFGVDSLNYFALDPVSSLFIDGSPEDLIWKDETCDI